MKFCTLQEIFNWVNVTWSKLKKCIGQTPIASFLF